MAIYPPPVSCGDPLVKRLSLVGQREALGLFESLQAGAAIELVRARLRSQGVKAEPQGPRPATRANSAQHTQREMEILVLLAAGHSNAEIARRLHRPVRTVENHVSALIGKLGARTAGSVLWRAHGTSGFSPTDRGLRADPGVANN